MASTQLRHSVNTMNCIAPGLYSNTAPESEICRPPESILPPLNCNIPTSLHSALWSDPDQVARSLIETDSMTNIKPWYASLSAHQRDNLSENLSHDGNGVFYPSETSSGFDESSPNELITKGPFSKHYGFNSERIDSTNITTDPSLSSPLHAGHRMQTSSDSEGHKLLNSSSSPGGSSAQNHTDCDHRDGPTEVGRQFEQNSLLGGDSYANSGRMLYVNNLFCAKALFCEARSMTTQSTCYSTVGDERSVQFRQWGEHQYGRNDHRGDQAITPEPDFKPVTDECGGSMEAPDYQPPFPRRVPPMGLHSANQTFNSSNLPHNPFSSPPVSRSVTAPQIAAAAAAAAVAAAAAASAATSLSSRPMPSVPQPADAYPPLFGQNFSHKPPSAPRIGPYDSKSFPQQAPAYPFSGAHPFVPAQSGPHLHQPPYPPYAGLRHFPSTGYPHGVQNSFGYGLDGTRRKNATRESTTTLKVWLQEHIKNPYPTKGEKIMLAIITKMTLTQVSTWFANARRRLKKENKMSWPPKSNNASTSGQTSPDNRNSTAPGENMAKPPRSEESCVKEREKRNSPQINEAEDSATDDEDASATDGEVEDSYMNENTLSVDKNLSDFSACNGPYYMNVPGRLRPGSDLAAGEGTEAQEPNSRPTYTGPGQIFRGHSPAAGNTLANGMRPCPNPLLTDPERLQSAEEYSGSFQNLRGFSRMYPKPVSFHPASSGRSRSPTVRRPENPLNSPISFEKIGRFPDRPPLEIDSGSLSLFNPYVPAARNSYTMPYSNTVPEVFPANDVIPQIPVPETALSRITTDLQPEKISYEQRIPFNFEAHENTSR